MERKVRATFVGPDTPLWLGNIVVTFRRREINDFARIEVDGDQLVGFLKRERVLRSSFDAAWTRFEYSKEGKVLSVASPGMPVFKLRF